MLKDFTLFLLVVLNAYIIWVLGWQEFPSVGINDSLGYTAGLNAIIFSFVITVGACFIHKMFEPNTPTFIILLVCSIVAISGLEVFFFQERFYAYEGGYFSDKDVHEKFSHNKNVARSLNDITNSYSKKHLSDLIIHNVNLENKDEAVKYLMWLRNFNTVDEFQKLILMQMPSQWKLEYLDSQCVAKGLGKAVNLVVNKEIALTVKEVPELTKPCVESFK